MSADAASSINDELRNARRIVVKVGSSLVTNEGRGVDAEAIGNWCRQMAALGQAHLADGGGGLQLVQLLRARRPAQALHAFGDRPGGDHHDLAARLAQHGHLAAPVADGLGIDASAFVGD